MSLVTSVLSVCVFLPGFALASSEATTSEDLYRWEELPSIPDAVGLAAPFAGVHNGALIVGGGANFPEGMPWEGGEKVWHDEVYVLTEPDGEWRSGFRLPRPLAYGISITTPEGVLCIGGDDATRFYRDVFLLTWEDGEIGVTEMPSLPAPAAYATGAMIGRTVYIAGGLSRPEREGPPLHTFWSLDLSNPELGWEELEPWPGEPRFLSVAAVQGGSFYLLSGATMVEADGAWKREYLSDGYRYTPGKGWSRIADLPRPAVAAPSPAPSLGAHHFGVIGGDDGSNMGFDPLSEHPGFTRETLVYHTVTDTWSLRSEIPFTSPVTVPTVNWQGKLVIPSGEVRPGVRSPSVWMGEPFRGRAQFGPLNYGVLVLYLMALVIIAMFFSRYQGNTREFFLGGQRIPWWAAGLSIFGTQLSAITFIAIPAQVYANDWTYILANLTIVLVAPLVVFCYLPFYRRLNITTAYEYLEQRFNLPVRLFGSAAFCFLQLGRMGIVLFIPAIALSAVTGINLFVAILSMGVLATLYTVVGGIKAVIWTDVLQVVVLMGGALLCLVLIAIGVNGGVPEIVAMGAADGKFNTFNWTWNAATAAVWVVLLGNFLANLVPYSADQTVVQRYLTTSSYRQAAKSIWTNAILTIPASLIFFSLGTALYVFYKSNPAMQNPHLASDAILPLFIAQMLPPGVAGLLIAAVFAAAMSSLDSSMNSVATTITTDYRRLRSRVTESQALRLARWITLGLGIFGTGTALFLASFEILSLWDAYLTVLGLFGGSLAGLFVLAIFTRRANGNGALVGAVASAAILYWTQASTDLHFFLYAGVGIGSCFIVGYLASLVIPGPDKEILNLTVFAMNPPGESIKPESPMKV